MLIPFLFWVGLLALVAWVVTRLFPRRRDGGATGTASRDPAEQILRERFARGEVTAEEYGRALEILRDEVPIDSRERGSRDAGRPDERTGGTR